jgi:hypothetical protein
MPNMNIDALFQLVKSLEKSEKRNFKLYATRNSADEELKIIQLFDGLDKMETYDEEAILRKNPSIKKQQLSNLKASLYKQILSSLRLLKSQDNIDIQLHEQLDFARILYNKALYQQALKVLAKIKENARQQHQTSFLVQVLFLEKKIEGLHITRSMRDRADQLTGEAEKATEKLSVISKLSNLALLLYSWYIKNGHARHEDDVAELKSFMHSHLPAGLENEKGFYERLYLNQSYCWFAFIRQDFLMYYRYTQKWVDLFTEEPSMIHVEVAHYIKGVHNLLNAHFYLKNYGKFITLLHDFERFAESTQSALIDNNKVQTFIYLQHARIHKYFFEGRFADGLEIVPFITKKVKEYQFYMDNHRVLIFYYKIASMYFGSGDYDTTIDYLNKIINWKTDLRTDLQCYSRLLHLLAHYELGNYELIEYLVKSVYRYMSKMDNISLVEEKILTFLKKAFYISPRQLKPAFEGLLYELKQLESNRFEARAFSYLDIVSWLESKISGKPIDEIIAEKWKARG